MINKCERYVYNCQKIFAIYKENRNSVFVTILTSCELELLSVLQAIPLLGTTCLLFTCLFCTLICVFQHSEINKDQEYLISLRCTTRMYTR